MRVCLRTAVIRREIKRLVAIAEKRAADAEGIRAARSFRPLTEAETEAIMGGEFLAALGDARRRA